METSSSSRQCSGELQISKSNSVQAEFIGDMFSWKRTDLAEVRVKGTDSGHGKERVARARAARVAGPLF